MKVLEKTEAQASLADYVEQINTEPIIIEIGGKPVAVLMSLEDVDWETISLSMNPQFLSIIQRSRLRDNTEGRVSSDEVRRMFAEKK
jgi:prevent-host-death family protein